MWIAHLSDPHVRPQGILYNDVVDANAALATAVRQINDLDPRPDLVLLTGDVVDEGSAAEYAAACAILAELLSPLLVIPGNHDERSAFRTAFADHAYLPADGPLHYSVNAGQVSVIACDVTVPGQHHGNFDEAAAQWLADALAEAPTKPTIVMMHQPPFSCGVPYLDRYRCFGEERFAQVVSRFDCIERILCGHVHRHMQTRIGGALVCTAPSTATAITLRPYAEAKQASFIEPPAFLLHQWRPDGMLTHYVPIGTFPGPFPFA